MLHNFAQCDTQFLSPFRMSNRPANQESGPTRSAARRPFETPFDILTLLNSKQGCEQLFKEIIKFIESNKGWFAIEQALEALEEDVLLINVFSTVYTAKPDGRFLKSVVFLT